MKQVNLDQQSYLIPNWFDMGKICFELAQNILSKEEVVYFCKRS